MIETMESVARLTRDLKESTVTLDRQEVRYLVDAYYQMQDNRIRAAHQARIMGDEEPHRVIDWLFEQNRVLEAQLKRALDAYSLSQPLGEWARSHKGLGPVITAGLLAHLDLETVDKETGEVQRTNTVSRWWRFAGLDPTVKWGKGKKRPWNARLKTLCWKLGESFVKVSGHEDAAFGKLYVQRKAYEVENNLAGKYADQAAAVLKSTPKHAQKAIYAEGKLPDGHIHARAKRWTVKLFLACYHRQGYRLQFGEEPPAPYPIAHLGHADLIDL